MLELGFAARPGYQVFFNGILGICLLIYRKINMAKTTAAQHTFDTVAPVQYSA